MYLLVVEMARKKSQPQTHLDELIDLARESGLSKEKIAELSIKDTGDVFTRDNRTMRIFSLRKKIASQRRLEKILAQKGRLFEWLRPESK